MAAITVARTHKGDDEVHRAGCADLKQARKFVRGEGWGTFSGGSTTEAIKAADADMAGAWCQKPYQVDASDPAWTVAVMRHAPCFVDMLNDDHIIFDSTTGEPMIDGDAAAESGAYNS